MQDTRNDSPPEDLSLRKVGVNIQPSWERWHECDCCDGNGEVYEEAEDEETDPETGLTITTIYRYTVPCPQCKGLGGHWYEEVDE